MKKIKRFIYKIAVKFIAYTIRKNGTQLTPELLLSSGWIKTGNEYHEPDIKDRDRVTITFAHHFLSVRYYRVWHSKDKTFIALDSSKEWLQVYLLLRSQCVEFNNPDEIFLGKGI
ncbi:hypothetical protein JYU20_00620 [Bacteroidales bacterium AH-315-I05]|nr:hypothetical protein [Bacteroidales bacterium AH-315-I05]